MVEINWDVALRIGVPILTLVIGAALTRYLERRPRLVAYYGQVSQFTMTTPSQAVVNTHAVVIKNTGRKSATNVQVMHRQLPDNYNVNPAMQHTVEQLKGGGAAIVFPSLRPKEEVWISYLYVPPMTYADINTQVKHDAGFAKIINVFLAPKYPKWVNRIIAGVFLLGVVAGVYILFEVVMWAVRTFLAAQPSP